MDLGTTGWSRGLAAVALLAGGCIGNSTGGCRAGETCVCSGIGNCDQSCPEGGCDFVCEGIGNCLIDCEGGGCTVSCEGRGNCILDCAGGDCEQTCVGTGNCICERGCGPEDAGIDAGPEDDAGPMSVPDAGMDAEDAGASDAAASDAATAMDGSAHDGGEPEAGVSSEAGAAADAG